MQVDNFIFYSNNPSLSQYVKSSTYKMFQGHVPLFLDDALGFLIRVLST